MNFEDEPYVRVYKRRTTTMAIVGWQARAVLRELFLVVDRAGVLDLDDEDPAEAVAAVLADVPIEVVRDALVRLVKKECVKINGSHLVIPRFREAQECAMSDSLRQKESRGRRRDEALRSVTNCDVDVTNCDTDVTVGHTLSRRVTQNSTEQCSTEQCIEIHTPEPSSTDAAQSQLPEQVAGDGESDSKIESLPPARHADHGIPPSDVPVPTTTQSPVSEPRSGTQEAQRTRRRPEVPIEMPVDWRPSDSLTLALAQKYETSSDRISACVAEFRVYWTEGKGSGTRRGPKRWASTFSNRIKSMAERGELYLGPSTARPRGVKAPRQVQPNTDDGPIPKEWTG